MERKFIVPLPLKWYSIPLFIIQNKIRVYHSFIEEPNGIPTRIRVVFNKFVSPHGIEHKAHYTLYTKDSSGKEYESAIDHIKYCRKLKFIDKSKNRIVKIKNICEFRNSIFELDLYMEQLEGLAILTTQVKNLSDKIILPPQLKISKEITNDIFFEKENLVHLNFKKENNFPRRID